jgi:hypothetical protein
MSVHIQASPVHIHNPYEIENRCLSRQCIVEIETTIIKATGESCCDQEAIQSCSATLAARLERPDAWRSKLHTARSVTQNMHFFHERLMDNGPHRVARRIAIGPWRPGSWRGGWRERLEPKLKHGVVVWGSWSISIQAPMQLREEIDRFEAEVWWRLDEEQKSEYRKEELTSFLAM